MIAKRGTGRVYRHRMFVGLLLAAPALAAAPLPQAMAEEGAAAVTLAQAAATDFEIPAQSLTDALVLFSRQSGLQVSAEASVTRDVPSPGVAGRMTAEAALQRLLAGSGISFRFIGESSVALERSAAAGSDAGPLRLAPITVDAVLQGTLTDSYAAPDNFASTRTNTLAIDTPQSTQAITRQALRDTGATEVSDAYDYLAGISRENNFGGITGDQYLARGFETDNILINGNRSGAPTTLDTANVERIEAIRGPTATLFGRADPGGLVNVVTKQPLSEPFYEAELQGGTGFVGDGARYRDVRATVDTGGPIDEQGRVRYRLNAAAEYERSFRQDIDDKLFFVSPVVDFEIDDRTIANIELVYQYRDFVFDRGVPFIGGEPRLPVDWYAGEDQAPSIDANYLSNTLRVDRELTDALTARLGIYTSYNAVDGEGIEIRRVLADATATAGRNIYDSTDLVVTLQPELVAEFETGPFGHTALFGIDASYRRNKFQIIGTQAGTPFDPLDTDFPVDVPEIDLSQPGSFDSFTDLTAKEFGVYVQNQIDLSDQWKLLAGLRWDAVWLDAEAEATFTSFFNTESEGDFQDNAFLPRVGLVYQPIEEIGLYASYSETYRPPTVVAEIDSERANLDPEEGRSLEVGIKLDALDGRLTGTLAAFRAEKENVIQMDPDNPGFRINVGRVRSQGVELDLAGEVFENFSVGISYAFTDAQIDSNENPTLPRGTRLFNVPRHAASLQAAYSFPDGALEGLRLFGGIVYEDEKKTNTSARIRTKIPDYVRFDLGASYELTENIQARLFIQNLTDEEYYTSANGENRVVPGQPLNATLGVRMRF